MRILKFLAVLSVVTLTLGASAAVAQPVANAGVDQTVAATYHAGQFVQLAGDQSTGEGLTFEWEVLADESDWTVYDDALVSYYGFGGSLTTSGAQALGFFPLGLTTVELTVSQPGATPEETITSTDKVVITVTDERYRSLVVYNRPWARNLPGLANSILTDCDALLAAEPKNKNFIIAQDAAEVAKTYEDFCQVMQFVYPYRDDYNTVVLSWYLPAREIQVQHHEGVAFHVFYGKGKSWSATETRVYNRALDAVRIGETDLANGTRSGQPLY